MRQEQSILQAALKGNTIGSVIGIAIFTPIIGFGGAVAASVFSWAVMMCLALVLHAIDTRGVTK